MVCREEEKGWEEGLNEKGTYTHFVDWVTNFRRNLSDQFFLIHSKRENIVLTFAESFFLSELDL